MARIRPYKNWEPADLREHLNKQVLSLNLSTEVSKLWIQLINDAFDTDLWNPIMDYNGCTLLQDRDHPCPACFVHDFMWICGYGGIKSDYIFKHLLRLKGMKRGASNRWWFGVRVGWIFYFYWKYNSRRELKPLTENMLNLYSYLKSKS